jgi:hypothetical protein
MTALPIAQLPFRLVPAQPVQLPDTSGQPFPPAGDEVEVIVTAPRQCVQLAAMRFHSMDESSADCCVARERPTPENSWDRNGPTVIVCPTPAAEQRPAGPDG